MDKPRLINALSPDHASGASKKKKRPKKNESNDTKTSKMQNSSSKVHQGNYGVDVPAEIEPKTHPRKIEVKQRSIGATAAVDSATSEGTTPPVSNDTGGFASGRYGVLLETKRAERLCLSFGFQKRHVFALHQAFKREEQLGTGEITTGEFFTMLHEQPRQLTNGIFEEVGLDRDIKKLCFDDFVVCVATVATWSKSELLHYAFKQFDVDDSGVMDGRELRAFCEGLKNDSSFYFANNVNIAREKLAVRDRKQQNQGSTRQLNQSSSRLHIDKKPEANTLVDLEDLVKGSTEFQVAFYPLMQLQQNVRACALGEQFWANITVRRQRVEVVVKYMRLHKGRLPPISVVTRIMAHLIPFSEARITILVQKLAVLKYAEEQRQQQEEAEAQAQAKARLTQAEEES
ncbi:unnamed protein product [Phytophthora fragariaefolia]|uniref:Unnamed protein product n=1 Tax=Phytophthora fragariaefolia TaxID=1490495 RepID=A0A9W7CRL0_9STRA|nr:unnamed protein product [Phytophthora fragariaefolia]